MRSHRVLFITDVLEKGQMGAATLVRSHIKAFETIFGKERIVILDIPGKIEKPKETWYISMPVTESLHKRLLYTLRGYTGRLTPRIVNEILLLIEKISPDLVFVDNSTYGKLVLAIKDTYPRIPVLTFYHDVKISLCREWVKHNPMKAPLYRNLVVNEKINQKICDVNIVLNDSELNKLKKFYPCRNTAILKMSTPDPGVLESKECVGSPLSILFLGAYYYPNVNGIDWFVNNVLLKLDSSKVKLTIAGRGMEVLSEKYSAYPNVSVVGRVENLQDTYMASDVVIGPIFEGAGMKTKTAEALSYGKCYVGTDNSLEGYLEDIPQGLLNKGVYRANTADEFISAIKDVMNARVVKKYNDEIYKYYEGNYSPQACAAQLKMIIEDSENKIYHNSNTGETNL